MDRDKKFTFIDLFAGCGGLSEGFLTTEKFEGLAHIEWEFPMVETLRNRLIKKWNYKDESAIKEVIHFDIQKTEELINGNWTNKSKSEYGSTNHQDIIEKGLKGLIGNKKIDLIIGGPPCQAYSIAGRAQDKYSMKYDYRNYLFESFVKIVDYYKPEIFLFENVPGILSAKPGDKNVTERIFEAFDEIGYKIRNPHDLKKSLYLASDFGVPQKRNRIIIIGVKKRGNIKLEDIYSFINKEKVKIEKTTRDAIGDLPKIFPLINPKKKESHYNSIDNNIFPNHSPRFHNERDVSIFKEWVLENMNLKSSIEKMNYYKQKTGKISVHIKYRNLEWDKPSPTIVAHLHKDGLMFIHPDSDQARSITVREAARLQTFPDDFEFLSTIGNNYKMIGNAVPVLMAKKIANGIYNYLNELR